MLKRMFLAAVTCAERYRVLRLQLSVQPLAVVVTQQKCVLRLPRATGSVLRG